MLLFKVTSTFCYIKIYLKIRHYIIKREHKKKHTIKGGPLMDIEI